MSDYISSTWRLSDESLSDLICVTPEITLDQSVFHQIVLLSAGYTTELAKVQFRKLINDDEQFLIRAFETDLVNGMSAQLTFGIPSLEVEVLEAKKKGLRKPLGPEAAVITALMNGGRAGQFFADLRTDHPVRANLLRFLVNYKRGDDLRLLTLNHRAMKWHEEMLPLTRARAFHQALVNLKPPAGAILPDILVCITEEPIRRALRELVGQETERAFWDRVKIYEGKELGGGKVQDRIATSLRRFHKRSDARVTLKDDVASSRVDAEESGRIAFEPLHRIEEEERYLELELPDLSEVVPAFCIDTNPIMECVKDRNDPTKCTPDINIPAGGRCTYFINQLVPVMIRQLEALTKRTYGEKVVVFLGRTQQMEALQPWERQLIGKSRADEITPQDHEVLDTAESTVTNPPRAPGYARRATKALVEGLKASPLIKFYEESGQHGMTSFAGVFKSQLAKDTHPPVNALRSQYEATLTPKLTKEQTTIRLSLKTASEDLGNGRDTDMDRLTQALNFAWKKLSVKEDAALLDQIRCLRRHEPFVETETSADVTIAYDFLNIIKALEAQRIEARLPEKKFVGIFVTADQSAAHITSLVDPSRIAAVPLEQGKHSYPDNAGTRTFYAGGKIASDVFLLRPIDDEEPLLTEPEVLIWSMRRCLHALVAASMAQLIA